MDRSNGRRRACCRDAYVCVCLLAFGPKQQQQQQPTNNQGAESVRAEQDDETEH
jgi:hypothetical protein